MDFDDGVPAHWLTHTHAHKTGHTQVCVSMRPRLRVSHVDTDAHTHAHTHTQVALLAKLGVVLVFCGMFFAALHVRRFMNRV